MILLDLSQVMYNRALLKPFQEIDHSLFRHIVLNCIRSYLSKFRDEYGELILASDSPISWRKGLFPYYKANRKKSRDASDLDWPKIFHITREIKDEIRENFPYRFIEIEGAEGDDVIATLTDHVPISEKVLILSSDKDFVQLQSKLNVRQYDPHNKRWVSAPDIEKFLLEHIIRGDASDGIPNILSPSNVFTVGGRQSPISEKRYGEIVRGLGELSLPKNVLHNFIRNRNLVDLTKTPLDIRGKIIAEYEKESGKARAKIFPYMVKHKLSELVGSIKEF